MSSRNSSWRLPAKARPGYTSRRKRKKKGQEICRRETDFARRLRRVSWIGEGTVANVQGDCRQMQSREVVGVGGRRWGKSPSYSWQGKGGQKTKGKTEVPSGQCVTNCFRKPRTSNVVVSRRLARRVGRSDYPWLTLLALPPHNAATVFSSRLVWVRGRQQPCRRLVAC